MASKIHLLKKSAIEAGAPENYYLNPSDNLTKMASQWRVVEHEGFLSVTIDNDEFGDLVSVRFNGKFICIDVLMENKEKAARFEHKDGMKSFTIEMNPNFLNLVGEVDPTINFADGGSKWKITKLKK